MNKSSLPNSGLATMTAQTRSHGKASAATTYRSTSAAPKQREFPPRRRSAKTYGRPKPASKLKQETLTQMDFTSSAREFIDLVNDDEDEEIVEEEIVELEPPKPIQKSQPKAKSRSARRKTTGDELYIEENLRHSKRRKTLGDSPSLNASSSFHTQTLTQMMSTNDRDDDPWQIEDSQDDEDTKISVETPKKRRRSYAKLEPQEGVGSAVPSLIQSVTPVNRQKKTEIPSSQSPATPMLLRYSPAAQRSPLMTKSTNVARPSPILKSARKTPKNAVIPDSYSTAHDSSPIPAGNSTVKATPSKQLRFNLPDDKENVTPGRTKPKSPKPKSQPVGRRPLQEVPDSDEDLDEDQDETVAGTEDETEDDEFSGLDPESPTPRRFRHVAPPPVENSGPEPGPLETATILSTESAVLGGDQLLDHELRSDPCDGIPSVSEPFTPHESPDPTTEAEDETPASPETVEAENDDLSPSQEYLYTQGLESQRVPLDSIRALGPQTPHSDIMVSLHPEHIARIVDRTKNHEFRAWKIPQEVSRIWVYITRPESELRYMCLFSEPKTPGEIEDEKGIGNLEFNQGKKAAKFAYEILQVYELNNPVSLEEMKRKGWVAGAPQKYTYIPPAVVGELTANLRCALFDDTTQSEAILPKPVSESEELKAQLQGDADYSTQHYSEATDEVIPASQTPRKARASPEVIADEEIFAKPARAGVRKPSSHHGSPSLPVQRQPSFVRPSQATTVSQVSSSPTVSPLKSGAGPILVSSQSRNSSPRVLRRIHSSLRSSQFATRSQLIPDSLLNQDIQEPPPIIWDSADERSD